MKKYYFIFVLILSAMVCNGTVQIKIKIDKKVQRFLSNLVTPDSVYMVVPDSLGVAIITLPKDATAGYGTLFYGISRFPLYFNNKSFDVTITQNGKNLHAEFSGEGSKTNIYLNTAPIARWMPDYAPEEAEFAVVLDQEEQKLKRVLDSCNLDKEFTRIESQRLHYMVQGRFAFYPLFHKRAIKGKIIPEPGDVYYESLRKLIIEDESLLSLVDYQLTLSDAVHFLSVRNHQKDPAFEQLKLKLNFIEQNLKNPAIVSHLVSNIISFYVKSNGMEDQAYFAPIYNAKVKDEKAKKEFNALCAKWAVIAPGQPSPAFSYPDINGKEVSLKDLAGKYVYIDVWATWCEPCRAQIPALKELEERYKDKDIHFVSLSSDGKKDTWEKMVKDEQLGGIQLFMNGDQAFSNAYMIEGIPRFILLDKEGKIMKSDMSRPSHQATSEVLDKLLN